MERYCLLVRADHELAGGASVTWADAAKQPLCLLTPDMQNRRIIDRAFRAANASPIPRVESNSVINLMRERAPDGHDQRHSRVLPRACSGRCRTSAPCRWWSRCVEHTVGLVAVDRDPDLAAGAGRVRVREGDRAAARATSLRSKSAVHKRPRAARSGSRRRSTAVFRPSARYFAGAGASPCRKRPT